MPKIIAYGRVSTNSQHTSLGSQKEACEKWVRYKREESPEHEYLGYLSDQGVSAQRVGFPQRPVGCQVNKLLQKDDILVVSNLDRLFRSVVDCAETVESFNDRGVNLVILDARIDTSSAWGKAMLSMAAIFKDLEANEIRRRTLEGKAYRAGVCSVAAPPCGWMKKDTHVYVADMACRLAGQMSLQIFINERPESDHVLHDRLKEEIAKSQIPDYDVPRNRATYMLSYAILGWPMMTMREIRLHYLSKINPNDLSYPESSFSVLRELYRRIVEDDWPWDDPADEITERNKKGLRLLKVRKSARLANI